MKILCLIVARAGSKRLPGKNTRLLGDKPLVVWSIDVAKGIPEICDILVSTDDPTIASICEAEGAYVPWLRPHNLATDTASSVDVALHALDWYESERGVIDGLLLLQPTSPFRTRLTVKRGIDLFIKYKYQPVIGVSSTQAHPMWTLKIEDDHLVPYMHEHGLETRSQDLPPAYVLNGSFYLITPFELRTCRSFFGTTPIPLVMEIEQECLDIDTEWDFRIAEEFLKNNIFNK